MAENINSPKEAQIIFSPGWGEPTDPNNAQMRLCVVVDGNFRTVDWECSIDDFRNLDAQTAAQRYFFPAIAALREPLG